MDLQYLLPPSTPSPHDLRSSPVLYAASSPPSSIRASAPPPVLRAASSPPSSALAFSPPHVLLLPFPAAQGHVNPMLQFGRRLAYHGLRPTLVTTRHLLSTLPATTGPFRVAAISDGFDAGGIASCPDIREYTRRFAAVGSETPEGLFRSEAAAGRPVRVLV